MLPNPPIPPTKCPLCGGQVEYIPIPITSKLKDFVGGKPGTMAKAFCNSYFFDPLCEWVGQYYSAWGKE